MVAFNDSLPSAPGCELFASPKTPIPVFFTYPEEPFGDIAGQSGTLADDNPFRFSTKYHDDEMGLVYYGLRYYSAELGRWPSRDPIGEMGGENLYAFVHNDPLDLVDPVGLDFIAAGVRSVQGLGAFGHMSIVYFETPCPQDPPEGHRFTPADLGQGVLQGAAGEHDRWELLNNQIDYVRYSGRFHPGRPPRRRPALEDVWVSVIHNSPDPAPETYRVLLAGATLDDWNHITQAARGYAYGEQLPLPNIPRNWPNSRYELPPLVLGGGNNSNTFVFEMAALIGRRGQAIHAFANTPGNNHARPVHDQGRTPFLRRLLPQP